MIHIDKPPEAPRILRERGQRTTDANQQAFVNGERAFKFDSSLYGAKSVKNALIKAQHGKCAFCEAQIRHISHGDVEHYRPKGGVRQSADEPMQQPGYFWLAYVWENLFLACQLCNQIFKRNLFPLADPATRAASHLDGLGAEAPLLLHPVDDDPSAFVGFRDEVAFPIDDDPRGRATIDVVGLNREEMVEHRFDHLMPFKRLRQVLPLLPPESEEVRDIQALFAAAVLAKAQYSSMMRALLDQAPGSGGARREGRRAPPDATSRPC
jgi:uncharacterized protein (TIGR02646 family)